MAQDGSNNNSVRRCGQIGDGEDDELSMVDVLNEQTRLEADADAVLGGSDAINCAYPQGYIKRQALYACATCTPEGNAGICLACSYACHEGHALYELYTKRFFTCDCGNEKFGDKECKLYKGTKSLNAKNCYNHNFKGVYCSCARPYPDPEDPVEDEMIQCILCEDWYHGRHLNTEVPDNDDFTEMTCPGCMSRYSFLWAYHVPRPVKEASGDSNPTVDETVDVFDTPLEDNNGSLGTSTVVSVTNSEVMPTDGTTSSNTQATLEQTDYPNHPTYDCKRKREPEENIVPDIPSSKKMKTEADQVEDTKEPISSDTSNKKECTLKDLQQRVIDCPDCAAFWPEGWRSKLCQCEECLQMYKDKEIEFLIDESDTVQAYEEKGRISSASSLSEEETTASALAGMDRVQQIEIVRGFIDFKTELKEFLDGFVQCGKVVTEADIQEFFQRLNQRRKDRVQTPQYYCR